MLRSIKNWLLTAAVAVLPALALLGSASSARATFTLTLSEDGGTPVVVATSPTSGGTLTFSGTFGDFTVTGSVETSNSPGNPLLALNMQGTTTITNNDPAGTHTLTIAASAQDFTTPSSPPNLNLTDTVSGSVAFGTASGSFMGFADTSNALFGTATPAGTLTVPSTPGGKSFSANGGVVTTLTGPYSLTDIGNYTLSGGGIITLTGGNVEVTPTPGPATMVMALAGLGTLAVGGWYRRARKPA